MDRTVSPSTWGATPNTRWAADASPRPSALSPARSPLDASFFLPDADESLERALLERETLLSQSTTMISSLVREVEGARQANSSLHDEHVAERQTQQRQVAAEREAAAQQMAAMVAAVEANGALLQQRNGELLAALEAKDGAAEALRAQSGQLESQLSEARRALALAKGDGAAAVEELGAELGAVRAAGQEQRSRATSAEAEAAAAEASVAALTAAAAARDAELVALRAKCAAMEAERERHAGDAAAARGSAGTELAEAKENNRLLILELQDTQQRLADMSARYKRLKARHGMVVSQPAASREQVVHVVHHSGKKTDGALELEAAAEREAKLRRAVNDFATEIQSLQACSNVIGQPQEHRGTRSGKGRRVARHALHPVVNREV